MIIMSSLPLHTYLATRGVIILLLYLLLSPISCFNQHHHPPPSPLGLVFEEKTRIGSIPPSCHNKCNGCHPCLAVQVHNLPGHSRVQPSLTRPTQFVVDPSYPSENRYSNYKALGWRCRCGDHFYNP